MGHSQSQQAGHDFNEVTHLNKTHVELAKRVVVNREAGFRLFDYVSESSGPTTIRYLNGTVEKVVHKSPVHMGFTALGLAFEVVL